MSIFSVAHADISSKVIDILKNYDQKNIITNRFGGILYSIRMFCIVINNNRDAHLPKDLVQMHSSKLPQMCFPGSRVEIECNDAHFDLLLSYMYDGALSIPRDQLVGFNNTVVDFGFDRLRREIAEKIVFESDTELLDVFATAIEVNNAEMIETCVKAFTKSYQSIPTDKIVKFAPKVTFEIMGRVLGAEEVHNGSELKIFLMFDEWVGGGSTDEEINCLKEFIRFESISSFDLINTVRQTRILNDLEYIEVMEKKLSQENTTMYVCNANNPIPVGYRIVTDEEFTTDKFRQEFIRHLFSGFESVGDLTATKKKNTYLLTASGKTVELNTKKFSICDMLTKSEKRDEGDFKMINSDWISLSLIDEDTSSEDAYICVKKN